MKNVSFRWFPYSLFKITCRYLNKQEFLLGKKRCDVKEIEAVTSKRKKVSNSVEYGVESASRDRKSSLTCASLVQSHYVD